MELFHGLIADNHTYIGMIVGFVLRYCWCQIKVRWLDKHHPLPDGAHRERPIINRSSIGMVLALGVVLFSLISVSDTSQRTNTNAAEVKQLSADAKAQSDAVAACEDKLAQAIADDRALSLENDALAAVERDLNSQAQSITDEWLSLVVNPPQQFFDLHTTDPRYQQWARGVNTQYQAKHQAIIDRQTAASAQRQAVVAKRTANPVPDPHCSKAHK